MRASSLVAAGLLLLACRVPPPSLSRDPSALLDEVRAAQARVERVRGAARLRVQSPSLSGTVTEFIAAEKPDRVHLETLDFFGAPVMVLVAGEGRFALLDLRNNVFYRGAATPRNVSRLLPFELPVEELVTILCGSAPLLPGAPIQVGEEGRYLLLTLGQGEIGQRLAVGEQAVVAWSRVRRAAPEGGGAPREPSPGYDLDFRSFADRGGVRFPEDVTLDAPASGSHVELSWRPDVEVNGAPDRALFRLEPPPGVRIEDVGTGEGAPPSARSPGGRE